MSISNVADPLSEAIEELINTYHEVNPSLVDELDAEPSPLEFMRYVHKNRPFIVRKGASHWAAVRQWNKNYLCNVMKGADVNVAVTPCGNADSVMIHNEELLFVKPHEKTVAFNEVIQSVIDQETQPCYAGPISYAQTQNDNLPDEYSRLAEDVPTSISFARIAFDLEPDAVNFWLGGSRSVTALHKDPYENIYVQVVGQKHFVLLPPVEAPCVGERMVKCATYVPADDDDDEKLEARLDKSSEDIPFATWDPDQHDKSDRSPFVSIPTPFSHLSQPYRLTLNPGDMLYLPALWYHKVSQSCGPEGFCVAVNYWYDMQFEGGFWGMSQFVRQVGSLARDRIERQRGVESKISNGLSSLDLNGRR